MHTPVSLGSTCTQGGNVCDATGSCVQCNVPADCVGLPPDDECQTRTCTAGVCGQSFAAAGTPLALQTTGDCSELVCDGAGSTMTLIDDTDVPVDGLDCTADVCTMGVPSNPPESAGTACAAGICDANGACVGCITAADCGTDTFCQTFTCNSSVCGVVNTSAGTALPAAQQSNGDCVELQCDGNGGVQATPDDEDLPVDDGNDCTDEICNAGVASHPNKPLDAVCSSTGIVCDGQGSCVACNSPSQCPQGAICETATCNGNACGLVDTPSGNQAPPSAQTSGDCTVVLCDGMGGTTNSADVGDVPFDANECTQDVCMGTTPSNPPQASGTPCQEGLGVCDGMGMCSLLSPNGDPCSTASQCLSGNCVDGVCCDTACSGLCQACSATKNGGTSGACGPVPAGQDPDAECPGVCDGALACAACNHVWSQAWG
ncbi:MAG TPA: hypothetical protein ENK57_17335, partial [Polyangiaceae bacterium]|nr:hypothetical protein [Polyangiaceae bacterium]